MTCEEREYFHRREMQERAAAKSARSIAARRVHQQMAESYAALQCGIPLADPLRSLRASGII